MNTERAVGIIGRSILTAAAMGGGEQVADVTYKAFISPSRAHVQILNPTETAHFLNKGLSFISIASAQSNLAELCRVGFRLRIAEYNETNGKEFYQDGEDQIAAIAKNARLTFQVASREVKAIVNNKPVDAVVTDNNGGAEFNLSPVECNGADGKSAEVVSTITTEENRIYTKTITAKNEEKQPYNIWLRRGGAVSTTPTASPTARPAASPTPDTRSTAPPPVATAPAVSPAQPLDLTQAMKDVSSKVTAIFGVVDEISKVTEEQSEKNRALKAVASLQERVTELEKDGKASKEELAKAREELAKAQKESEDKSKLGLAGLGVGVLGIVGAVGAFIWARRRRPAEPAPAPAPVEPAPAPVADGGPADDPAAH